MSENIDLHIELSLILNFINEQIESNIQIPIDKDEIYDCLKRAVISSSTKPFLYAQVAKVDRPYYEKYVRLEKEYHDKYIPDFFSYEGDFYDLAANVNISKRNTEENVFQQLFLIKILELNFAGVSIYDFFNFQLYDNFYGNKESFAFFLHRFTEKDINPYLLPIISESIIKWIKENGMESIFSTNNNEDENIRPIEKNEVIDTANTTELKNDDEFYNTKRNYKIPGNFTDDEIRHYFSFLYLEKGADKQPFLNEDAVKLIFENGLIIPEQPLIEKFKLHRDPRIPKSNVDFAIHKLISKNSLTARDKNDYLIFMGSYIENYDGALESSRKLVSIGKNISGEKPSKCNIAWNKYLPERFHD
jgi:hypothetical protein